MAKKVKQRMRAMWWSVFERKFEPISVRSDGDYLRQYGEITEEDPHKVWSVVESDTGDNWYVIPGYHVVNMLGYVQTRKPWTDEDDARGLEVRW